LIARVVEHVPSAPSGAVASLDAAGLSPALADLLKTFIRAVPTVCRSTRADGSLRRWLLQHDCSHIDAAASHAIELPYQGSERIACWVLAVVGHGRSARPR
jgi:hypothetical protein